MITGREIKEKAREYGVPVSTIERDYAQNWLLKFMNFSFMTLKGGTGIRKTYIENYRFSDDLDFTLLKNLKEGTLQKKIGDSVRRSGEESGIKFESNLNYTETESGFRTEVYFNLIKRSGGTPIKIRLDFTTKENEIVLKPLDERRVYHLYSDKYESYIKVYSLEEIIAEKIRSLFQRTRPRDLYDLWYFRNYNNGPELTEILKEKCSFRGVKIDIFSLQKRKNDFGNAWMNSLKNQIKEVPEFNEVFNTVISGIASYEAD